VFFGLRDDPLLAPCSPLLLPSKVQLDLLVSFFRLAIDEMISRLPQSAQGRVEVGITRRPQISQVSFGRLDIRDHAIAFQPPPLGCSQVAVAVLEHAAAASERNRPTARPGRLVSHDDPAMLLLHRGGENLRCARRQMVDQHGQPAPVVRGAKRQSLQVPAMPDRSIDTA